MKGHTKIELTDVNTGKVDVIEHDNMITSAIEKELLSSNGIMPCCISSQAYTTLLGFDYIHSLFGGIFLFNNTLSTDKDDYLIPFDNEMTGFSYYNVQNSGSNVQLGSYSDKESGLQEDGSFKFVYNFDTTQANGQISSVALTPYISGILSAGIKEGNYVDNKYPSNFSSFNVKTYCPLYPSANDYGLNMDIKYNGIPVYIDDENIYFVDYKNFNYRNDNYFGKNGRKINISKYTNKIGKIHPFDKYNSEYNKIEEFTVNLPENFTFSNVNGALFDIHEDGTFYFITGTDTIIQGKIQLVKIDIIGKTSTLYTFSLPTNKYLLLKYTGDGYVNEQEKLLFRLSIYDNKFVSSVLLNNSSSSSSIRNLYIHDLVTGEDTIIDTYPFTDGRSDVYCSKLYNKKYLIVQGSTTGYEWFALDLETKKLLRINTNKEYFTFNTLKFLNRTFYYESGIYNLNSKIYICSPCQFLTTKNNLEKPVTKTSSQSMKVTYTLTPA